MFSYRRRRILTVGESWFSADPVASGMDIVHFRSLAEPLEDTQEFTTIRIDLNKPEEQLLAEMSKSTRHHIRKGGECGFRYEYWHADAASQLDEFIRFLDASNAAKGLPPGDRVAIYAHAECGVLDLSRVSDSSGDPLVWHGHYRDRHNAQQTYTASVFRARLDSEYRTYLGRANRWGCWEDMRRFRRDGIRLYDFGGWYPGTENQQLLAVNFFKEGFGGSIVKTYFCTRPLTWFGRLYLWAGRVRSRPAGPPAGEPAKAAGGEA